MGSGLPAGWPTNLPDPVLSVTVAGFEILATASGVLMRDTRLGAASPALVFDFRTWLTVTDAITHHRLPVCAYQPGEVQATVPEGGIALVWDTLDATNDWLGTLVFTAGEWAEFTDSIRAAEEPDPAPEEVAGAS